MIGLHLSEYQELFEAEGYASAKDVDNLLHLTESDLLEMGITKRGAWGMNWEGWSGGGGIRSGEMVGEEEGGVRGEEVADRNKGRDGKGK